MNVLPVANGPTRRATEERRRWSRLRLWCWRVWRPAAVWLTAPASVVIETETPVPHYPDRTHSSYGLWSTGPINRKPLFEQRLSVHHQRCASQPAGNQIPAFRLKLVGLIQIMITELLVCRSLDGPAVWNSHFHFPLCVRSETSALSPGSALWKMEVKTLHIWKLAHCNVK